VFLLLLILGVHIPPHSRSFSVRAGEGKQAGTKPRAQSSVRNYSSAAAGVGMGTEEGGREASAHEEAAL